jgi:hypothetical protein
MPYLRPPAGHSLQRHGGGGVEMPYLRPPAGHGVERRCERAARVLRVRRTQHGELVATPKRHPASS